MSVGTIILFSVSSCFFYFLYSLMFLGVFPLFPMILWVPLYSNLFSHVLICSTVYAMFPQVPLCLFILCFTYLVSAYPRRFFHVLLFPNVLFLCVHPCSVMFCHVASYCLIKLPCSEIC